MMLSILVIAALMPALVLSTSGKAPADAHTEGPIMKEQDRYIEIAKHLGNIWSKLLLASVKTTNSDFSGDCTTVAEKVQDLAAEIAQHYEKNLGNIRVKAKSVLKQMETLKSDHTPSKADKKHTPSVGWTEEYVNEMVKNSKEIMNMIGGLADAKHTKNGSHEAIENGN